MKKALLILIWILIFGGIYLSSKYNTLVQKDETVTTAWAQVETQYQRRFDLIPSLVATVQGEANFERSTLEAVVNARASATKLNINIDDAQEMAEFQKEQSGISQALSRLLMVTENYPNLKANQAFADLRVQLEGTENRISTQRMRYNEIVQDYNTYVRKFPTNITASMFGFEKANLFESDEWAQNAPAVEFNFE